MERKTLGPVVLAAVATLASACGVSHAATKPAGCQPSWSIVPSPDGGPTGNGLYGVAALSSDDVWTVGTYFTNRALSLIEHWDGAEWTVVGHPETGDDSFLLGADGVAPTDVWAAGYYHDQVGQKTFTLHWDGLGWIVIPSPNVGLESALWAVDAVSSTDVWAVGSGIPRGGGSTFTLVEHWDGATWTVTPSPTIDGSASLASVHALSATDAWAVGTIDVGFGVSETLIEHWDGLAWTIVPSPSVVGVDNALNDVVVLAPDDAWAVGGRSKLFVESKPSILHWNGTEWAPIQGPAATVSLDSIAAVTTDDIWTVGGGFEWRTLIEHWDGSRWRRDRSPHPQRITLHAATALSSADIWAVGASIDAQGDVHALIEHHCG
jgi:hypothetical protein